MWTKLRLNRMISVTTNNNIVRDNKTRQSRPIGEEGLTLIELVISILIFLLVLSATSSVYIPIVKQMTQQAKIAEEQMRTSVGLELLRNDVSNAGLALPWSYLNSTIANYTEATTDPASANDSPTGVPRAVVVKDSSNLNPVPPTGVVANTDYMVIKGANVNTLTYSATSTCGNNIQLNTTAGKWTYIYYTQTTGGSVMHQWATAAENMTNATDNVFVLNPMSTDGTSQNVMVTDGTGNFTTTYSNTALNPSSFNASFSPATHLQAYLLYGVDSTSAYSTDAVKAPRMPFSRADYYVSQRRCSLSKTTYCNSDSDCTTGNLGICFPSYCAPNTGVLVKAMLNQRAHSALFDDFDLDRDGVKDEIPLVDCVANLQVVLGLDTDGDGVIGTYTDTVTTASTEGATTASVTTTLASATLLRQQLREIRVYILTHEGQKDKGYSYNSTTINVGETLLGTFLGYANFPINTFVGTDYVYYRWRLLKLVAKPTNMRTQ